MASNAKVEFIDTSKEVKKTMAGLSKTALRASAKVIRKLLRDHIPKRSNNFKNHIGSWVFIDKQTGHPQLWIGFYSRAKVLKKKKQPSHASPHWIEYGTNPHHIPNKSRYPKGKFMAYGESIFGFHVNHPGQQPTHVLRDTVYNNIDEIHRAQAQYLAALNREMKAAGAIIDDSEEEEDD